jgi:hypothetical protein
MEPHNLSNQLPSLNLVLALDAFCEQIVSSLHQPYMGGNPAYQNTRLLALRKKEQAFQLVDLGHEPALTFSSDASQTLVQYGDLRREAYKSLIDNSVNLRQDLEIVLHNLRAHPQLLQSGLSYGLFVNLNICLIGDLTNPHTSGLLLPLFAVLHDILAGEPYCSLSCLLRVGLFPQTRMLNLDNPISARISQESAAGLHVALHDLDNFLHPAINGLYRRVAMDLELPDREPTFQNIFLFDRRKEGSLMVQDEQELSVIMGNFCLALLSGDLPQRLVGSSEAYDSEQNPVYKSAAASALLYTPERLLQACAAWLGEAFLANAIPEEQSPAPAWVTDLTKKILPELGTLVEWLELGCQGMPFQPSQGDGLPGLAMHLEGPSFQNIPPSEWADLLRRYGDHLFETELPVFCEGFLIKLAAIQSQKVGRLQTWLQGFTQDGLGMGAGFRTLTQAAQVVEGRILENLQHVQDLMALKSAFTQSEFETALQALESLAAQPPYRPSVKSLRITLREEFARQQTGLKGIRGFRTWLSDVILRWLRRGEMRLIAARECCLHFLEQACINRFLNSVLPGLQWMGETMQGLLVQSYEDIDNLQETFHLSQALLKAESEKNQAALFTPAPLFRPNVVSPAVFRWASERWRPAWEEMQFALIHQFGILNDWRQLSPEMLVERLLAYCRMIYAPELASLSLMDIFDHSEARLPQGLPPVMVAGSIPLLRANFDRLGGGATTGEIHGLQTHDLQAETIQALAVQTSLEWESVGSSDRRALFIYQVRQGLPLKSLTDLLRQGQKAWETLEDSQRERLRLSNESLKTTVDEKSNGRYRTFVG